MINNSKNPSLTVAYTDAAKNVWYQHTNPLEISAIRAIRAERAQRFFSMNITERELTALLEEQSEAAKTLDVMRVLAISQEIKLRLKLVSEEKAVLDIANIYFFLEDEDPAAPSDAFEKKKLEIWEKDRACKGFFLRMGLHLTNKLATTSEDDLLKYMEQTKKIAERINMFLEP